MADPDGRMYMPHPLRWLKEKLMADPDGPMQWGKAVFLLFYLLTIGGLMVYFVYGLWAAEPKAAQRIPAAEPLYKDDERPTGGLPKIKLIDPQTVTIGIGQANIRIFGYNFTRDSNVRFNGATRLTQYVNEHQLVVSLASSDFAAPGVIVVDVVNGDKRSDAVTLAVEAAGTLLGEWGVFWCLIRIPQEIRLILLVLFTGALGACMSSLQSLADYTGERKLRESWFTFYVVRPPLGAGIAFIFYLVIRGGFLATTNADAAIVNPFALVAVAALVGMFSDKAIMKLREAFLMLFKPDDTRSDTLGELAITTATRLPDARVNVPYTHRLVASGGAPPYTWAAVTPLPAWLALDAATGTLTGTPPAAAPLAVSYTFRVTDSTGASATANLELTVLP